VQRFRHIYMCEKLTGGAIFLSVSKWIFCLIVVALGFWGTQSDFFFGLDPPPVPPLPTPIHTRYAHRAFCAAKCNASACLCCALEAWGSGGGAGEWGRGSWDAQTEKRGPKNHRVQGLSNVQRFRHIYMCQKLTGGAIFLSVSKWGFCLIAVAPGFWGTRSDFFFQSGPTTRSTPAHPYPHAIRTSGFLRHSMLCMCMSVLCAGGVGGRGWCGGVGKGVVGRPNRKTRPKKSQVPGVGNAAHWI